MRILLAQNMRYLPSHGGANKSNRLILEQLAERGHDCCAVAPLAATEQPMSVEDLHTYLTDRGIRPDHSDRRAVVFTAAGVRVHVVIEPAALGGYLREVVDATSPDRVLVPSDDPGLVVLGNALRAAPDRVIYLAHTLQQLPLGPRSFYQGDTGLRLLRRVAGVIAVSTAAEEYLRRWGGLSSALIYPPVYGSGPFPRLASPSGAVTLVNPCGYKGLPILSGLAEACPEQRFLAVASWGTTAADRAAMAAHPNIEVIEPVDDITTVLARTRVLLMPSLWDETFGYTAVEAMLHGIPILASDVGGLREATLGVADLLPVTPITEYREQTADEPFPAPVIPAQDIRPWLAALRRLLTDDRHYTAVADAGAVAAAGFVAKLDIDQIAAYLADPRPVTEPGGGSAPAVASPGDSPAEQLTALSPQRQAALARLLARQRASAAPNPTVAAARPTARPAAGLPDPTVAVTQPTPRRADRPTAGDAAADDLATMLLIRHFETALLDLYTQGVLNGTTHTCLGQEYVPVALAALLDDGDYVFSNHRGHGHYLARFGDPAGLLAEIMGRAGAVCCGVGGSQHILRGRYLSTGVQGESVPVAAGTALHLARAEPGRLACVHIGDGTFGEGAVYEALNLAALWRLPLLVVVENNGIAQSTPTGTHLAGTIAARAAAFGIPHQRIESFDVEAIRAALTTPLTRVREGGGPLMVEFVTRRLGPHSKGDDTRPAEELERLRAADWLPWYAGRHGERLAALDRLQRERVAAVVADVSARPLSTWQEQP